MELIKRFEYREQSLEIVREDNPGAPAAPVYPVPAPGAGSYQVDDLQVKAQEHSVAVNAKIRGKNIAFLFAEILMWDEERSLYYGPLACEGIPAAQEREVGGVVYPDWPEEIHVQHNLPQKMYLLTDGEEYAFAFSLPMGYGQSGRRLDGQYTPAGETHSLRARLEFNTDGDLKRALVFKPGRLASRPHALTFKPGDCFAPGVAIFSKNDAPEGGLLEEKGYSNCLTWQNGLRIEKVPFWAGNYSAGIIVQDLDGKKARIHQLLS